MTLELRLSLEGVVLVFAWWRKGDGDRSNIAGYGPLIALDLVSLAGNCTPWAAYTTALTLHALPFFLTLRAHLRSTPVEAQVAVRWFWLAGSGTVALLVKEWIPRCMTSILWIPWLRPLFWLIYTAHVVIPIAMTSFDATDLVFVLCSFLLFTKSSFWHLSLPLTIAILLAPYLPRRRLRLQDDEDHDSAIEKKHDLLVVDAWPVVPHKSTAVPDGVAVLVPSSP